MNWHIKKAHIFSVILILVIGLFFAFYYIHTYAPEKRVNSFSDQVVAPEVTTFKEYYRARVLEITEEEQKYSAISPKQNIKVKLLTGSEKDKELDVENQDSIGTTAEQKIKQGDIIIIGKLSTSTTQDQGPLYIVIDKYRLPAIGLIVGVFFVLALLLGKMRGATSIAGLTFSIFLLAYFIVPSIMAGKDPLVISLVGSALIVVVSIFLAHGFNERSGLATISTFITLGIATLMSYYFVHIAKLFGLGSEDAYYLQSGLGGTLNLKGLLLAGIIIGTLGILDDVTTTQTAVVDELAKTNKKLSFWELATKAMSVGKEHIASLVNTLVLAYAGASLPLFILATIFTDQPLWIVINSEFVAEEIIRTLVGSTTLILAIPISTLIAAYYFNNQHSKVGENPVAP